MHAAVPLYLAYAFTFNEKGVERILYDGQIPSGHQGSPQKLCGLRIALNLSNNYTLRSPEFKVDHLVIGGGMSMHPGFLIPRYVLTIAFFQVW